MIFKRKFIKRVTTDNTEIVEETYIEQKFLFGIKFYEDNSDYKNELIKHKPGFK